MGQPRKKGFPFLKRKLQAPYLEKKLPRLRNNNWSRKLLQCVRRYPSLLNSEDVDLNNPYSLANLIKDEFEDLRKGFREQKPADLAKLQGNASCLSKLKGRASFISLKKIKHPISLEVSKSTASSKGHRTFCQDSFEFSSWSSPEENSFSENHKEAEQETECSNKSRILGQEDKNSNLYDTLFPGVVNNPKDCEKSPILSRKPRPCKTLHYSKYKENVEKNHSTLSAWMLDRSPSPVLTNRRKKEIHQNRINKIPTCEDNISVKTPTRPLYKRLKNVSSFVECYKSSTQTFGSALSFMETTTSDVHPLDFLNSVPKQKFKTYPGSNKKSQSLVSQSFPGSFKLPVDDRNEFKKVQQLKSIELSFISNRNAVKESCLHSFSDKENLQVPFGKMMCRPYEIGFKNFGNTCFVNATLQALFALTSFTSSVRKTLVSHCPSEVHQLLLKLLESRDAGSIEQVSLWLRDFCANLWCIHPSYAGFEQQDAHEFLVRFLHFLSSSSDKCHEAISDFEFAIEEVRLCTNCGNSSSQMQLTSLLCLNLTEPESDLITVMSKTFAGESCSIECPKCRHLPNQISFKMTSLPKILTILVNRDSCFNEVSAKSLQITDFLNFSKTEFAVFTPENSEFPTQFKLKSVIYHLGPWTSSGHYVAHCLCPDGRWRYYDDQLVELTTLQELQQPKWTASSYVCFYVRKLQ